jgi:hypothetical protein
MEKISILLDNDIAPRLQIFINKDNINELYIIEELVKGMKLEGRCNNIGKKNSLFVHHGFCDRENIKLYDIQITKEDIEKIPKFLMEYTLKHFNKDTIRIFWSSENDLDKRLLQNNEYINYISENPVFFNRQIF